MRIEGIELRAFNVFWGEQERTLTKTRVEGVAAEVVFRLRLPDGIVRDVIVHVPPIDVRQLAEARQLDSNTAAMALGLTRLEEEAGAAAGLDRLPSVMLVQPGRDDGPVEVPEETIQRARQLLSWEPIAPGGAHAGVSR